MKRQYGESGAALILLLGITATLTILTASLVMLLANQQRATANSRQSKTSLYYAEAALDSGVNAIKVDDHRRDELPDGVSRHRHEPGERPDQMNTQYAGGVPVARADAALRGVRQRGRRPSPARTGTRTSTTSSGSRPRSTTWVTRAGCARCWTRAPSTSILPEAALYADTSIVANGTSDVYAVKPDGTFYTPGPTSTTT